ncbi:hypothetical protein Tco_1330738 [Tanacetum coccineum]
MHTTMVPEQVKTMKIQAGIQVSRPRELTRQLQLWKRFGRLYLIVFVLVSNIHMESLRESIQERAKHKQEYDRRMNDIMMQSKEGKVDSSKALDAGLVVTKSNETESERHVSSSRSRKDTHAKDADINSVNDK